MFMAGWHEFQFKPHSLPIASAGPRTCKCRQTHCSWKTEDVGQNEKKNVTRVLRYLSSFMVPPRCSGVSALLKRRADHKNWSLCMVDYTSHNITEIEPAPFHNGPESSNVCKYLDFYSSRPASSRTELLREWNGEEQKQKRSPSHSNPKSWSQTLSRLSWAPVLPWHPQQ